ncbi:MAG TPA: methyltransferase domain-containing protein [Thermoanaerobaculia bacterium]|nr:methyltransferase domain-containing protein [Thermoanaerobaculia bacterium]
MRKSLLSILVDPSSRTPLELRNETLSPEGEIVTGELTANGRTYPIFNGIPRFVATADQGQKQTEESFGYKWRQRDTYESEQMYGFAREWMIRRYGFGDEAELKSFFAGAGRVLDAGCGGGFSSGLYLSEQSRGQWVGADISEAIDVARDRLGHFPGTEFVQADVLELPFAEESFDVILSEGVLHHTPSTERAFKSLVPLLKRGGEVMFYVYRRKGPIREFSDDYIRGIVAPMAPEEAWDALRPLTKLAQALSELKTEVDVPEDIPYLGIKAGRQDVQRLIYWSFLKLFWNDQWTFEQNNHVNFDWYHPRYAHRQSEEEITRWCRESGLEIRRVYAEESGYSFRAVRT